MIRNLDEHPRPVTGFHITANRAPVFQVAEDLNSVFDDFMCFCPIDINGKTDATGIMFEPGIIQTRLQRHITPSYKNEIEYIN
jgi:hypothetical protein